MPHFNISSFRLLVCNIGIPLESKLQRRLQDNRSCFRHHCLKGKGQFNILKSVELCVGSKEEGLICRFTVKQLRSCKL